MQEREPTPSLLQIAEAASAPQRKKLACYLYVFAGVVALCCSIYAGVTAIPDNLWPLLHQGARDLGLAVGAAVFSPMGGAAVLVVVAWWARDRLVALAIHKAYPNHPEKDITGANRWLRTRYWFWGVVLWVSFVLAMTTVYATGQPKPENETIHFFFMLVPLTLFMWLVALLLLEPFHSLKPHKPSPSRSADKDQP